MGRKRKKPVTFWLSENELSSLKNKISKTSLTRSDYLRKCSLNKNIIVIPGIRDLVIEIKRIGNNLNQLTRSVNRGTLTVLGDDFKVIKEDLKIVWDRLAAALKKI
jgi:hypothetical protein